MSLEPPLVLVTGVTGTVGKHLPPLLHARGRRVRALIRRPEAASELGDQVEIAVADLGDPASLPAALDGVDRVFLCTANHPQQFEHETNLIDAAAAAGVELLVKVGAARTRAGSPIAFYDAHSRIEAHLQRSGLSALVLSPTTYMSNLLAAAATIRATGQAFSPAGAAAPAMIDPRDVAEAAAVLLTEAEPRIAGPYVLTGPEPLTFAEIVARLGAVLGRPLTFVPIPDDAAHAAMVEAGLSDWLAGQIVNVWREMRAGPPEVPTGTVRELLGRPPRTVDDFCLAHAARFS